MHYLNKITLSRLAELATKGLLSTLFNTNSTLHSMNDYHQRIPIGDATHEIAISKAISRVHGPFLVTCTACGKRYWPDEKEEHLIWCRPSKIQKRASLNKQINYSSKKPHRTKNTCPFCGKKKLGLSAHIHIKHQKNDKSLGPKTTPPPPTDQTNILLLDTAESTEVIVQSHVVRIARDAWIAVSNRPQLTRLKAAKKEVIRLFLMLSPLIKGKVEYQFISTKWAPLIAAKPSLTISSGSS